MTLHADDYQALRSRYDSHDLPPHRPQRARPAGRLARPLAQLRRRRAARPPARDRCAAPSTSGVTHFDLANNYGPPYGSAETQLRPHLRAGLQPLPRRADHLHQGRLRHVAGPLRQGGGSRKYLLASLDQSLAPDGPGLRRHLLQPPLRPRHAARGDDGRARHRRPPGQGALRRHLLLLGRQRTREAAADPAGAGHAAAHPPAVVLDAQPLGRGGPARRRSARTGVGLHRVLAARAGHAHRQVPRRASRRARARRRTSRSRPTC